MATPFFLPPPSSFEVPPGCTVSLLSPSQKAISLSWPLFLCLCQAVLQDISLLHLESGCCSKQVLPSANPTQVTSRGLFSWLRTGVTCPLTVGLRKSCEKKYFFPSPKKCDTCSHFHAVSFIGNGDDVVSHFFKRMYCIRFFKKIEGNQWNSSTFLFQPELHPPEKIVWYVISNAILQSLP